MLRARVPYAGRAGRRQSARSTSKSRRWTRDVALGGGIWLELPGGAPGGYLRYADDAFAVDFTLPDTIGVDAATPAVLFLDPQDLAEVALDADPATAVDWGGGHWVGYENAQGVAGDSGGGDCSFKPFIAADAGAAPPARRDRMPCGTAAAATTPASAASRRRR